MLILSVIILLSCFDQMTDSPKDPTIGSMLHDTGRLMRKLFDQKARHIELSRSQWRVLVLLSRLPGIKQAALAEHLEIEPITLSRQIDRMEDAGWVRREQDPSDRRVRLLYITEQALPVMDKLKAMALQLNAQAVDGLSAGEVEAFVRTMQKIRANLSDKTIAPGE